MTATKAHTSQPRLDTPAHECAAADTISSTLNIHGLDVTITAFNRSPESMEQVVRLERALVALFTVLDPSN